MLQIAYIIFLLFFSYCILVHMDDRPSLAEIYAIAYICTLGCEKVREIATSEPATLSHKFSVWAWNMWNPCDAAAIIFFQIGLALRLRHATLDVGRVIYCVDCIYWYLRILNILGVNKYFGMPNIKTYVFRLQENLRCFGYIKKRKKERKTHQKIYKYITIVMPSVVFHRSSGNYDGKNG